MHTYVRKYVSNLETAKQNKYSNLTDTLTASKIVKRACNIIEQMFKKKLYIWLEQESEMSIPKDKRNHSLVTI